MRISTASATETVTSPDIVTTASVVGMRAIMTGPATIAIGGTLTNASTMMLRRASTSLYFEGLTEE